jgi:type IV pilus assembly protein PilW
MTMNREQSAERGFTLIEILVSFAIFLSIFLVVLRIYSSSSDFRVRSEKRLDIQQNARLAIALMTRQIRMGGYYPENFGSPAPSPLIANPVYAATDTAFAFHGDSDGNGTSNMYVFCLDGTTLRSLKQTPGTSIACSTGNAVATNVTSLNFAYFDKNGVALPNPPTAPYQLDSQAASGVPSLTTTTQRDAVRRVVITMTARTDTLGIGTESYSLTSDVWMRNGS